MSLRIPLQSRGWLDYPGDVFCIFYHGFPSFADKTGHPGKQTIAFYPFILIDFSLTVKAATLIFISGRDSAISSAIQEISGSIY